MTTTTSETLENPRYNHFVLALELAITAPNEEKCREVAAMAKDLAARLTPEQIEEAQATVCTKLGIPIYTQALDGMRRTWGLDSKEETHDR